jgi:hypothetical protein
MDLSDLGVVLTGNLENPATRGGCNTATKGYRGAEMMERRVRQWCQDEGRGGRRLTGYRQQRREESNSNTATSTQTRWDTQKDRSTIDTMAREERRGARAVESGSDVTTMDGRRETYSLQTTEKRRATATQQHSNNHTDTMRDRQRYTRRAREWRWDGMNESKEEGRDETRARVRECVTTMDGRRETYKLQTTEKRREQQQQAHRQDERDR